MNYGVDIKEYAGKKIGVYGGKFLPFHNGHLNCIMKAQSLVDVLFVVVGYDDEYDKALCANSKLQWISSRERERMISRELRDLPNIRVFSQYEPRTDDYMIDERVGVSTQSIIATCGGKVDVVFSSEVEYESYFAQYFPKSKHVVLDAGRTEVNISATKLRTEGVYKHWNLLPKSVKEFYTKRVAICGIESVGKTHLLKMLSSYFNTNHLEEYGRVYYDELDSYTDVALASDYEDIAVGHVHQMNIASRESNKVLLVDTDLIYTQYFHFRQYGKDHDVLDAMIKGNVEKIDAYIYIKPHNFHELDGTRRPVEEETRQRYNSLLEEMYSNYGRQLCIVDEPERLKRFEECVKIIENVLK
jgi:HTH-type transcriptional regulator, transcriptional repressor of NAD biosynthesis genes